jgi:hypothetical protein
MKIFSLLFFLMLFFFQVSLAQPIATWEVSGASVPVPMQIGLDELTFLPESELQLYLVAGKNTTPVAFQIRQEARRTLHWIVPATAKKLTYRLEKGKAKTEIPSLQSVKENGTLTIQMGSQKLLRYQYQTFMPPAGIDSVFKRSGFVHPLWTPKGQELTRIQPPDHLHHFGIWNPWTLTLFEKDTIDFWNLVAKKGTVRFANFTSQHSGQIFSEFEALHQHVVFKKDGKEKIALNELLSFTVYQPAQGVYLVDVTSKLICATESPITLLTYRYGGLGWRTTGFWDNKNSEVLTSEGKGRREADGSTAKWCLVQGALPENNYGGAAILSFPTNYNHPEPLRVWPENQYDRGDLFVNFSPTKNKDWHLDTGKTYILKYRWVVFDGKLTKEQAEAYWQTYANPPKVKLR